MWYSCGNSQKFCGFLAVRHIAVSYGGYLPLFPGRQRQIPNIWYCYVSDRQKTAKFMAVPTTVPHLRSRLMLDISSNKRSKPGYYQSLCSQADRGKYGQIPNIWYCYVSDCQKTTKFMAVPTTVPHLRSRLTLDISSKKKEASLGTTRAFVFQSVPHYHCQHKQTRENWGRLGKGLVKEGCVCVLNDPWQVLSHSSTTSLNSANFSTCSKLVGWAGNCSHYTNSTCSKLVGWGGKCLHYSNNTCLKLVGWVGKCASLAQAHPPQCHECPGLPSS